MRRGPAVPIADILGKLDGVRPTGPGRWVAKCPAHMDKSPSLSVREMDDGRVLLNDFGGCDTDDVLEALELPFTVLFPKGATDWKPPTGGIQARDLLVILDHELTVAVLILNEITEGRKVNQSQVDRLIQAAQRVGKARALANPARPNNEG